MRSICLLAFLACLASSAIAGSGAGAIIQAFNTDAATEGMGSAAVAAWWHAAPDPSSNPSMLGYHRGVSYHHFRSQLAVGLADDIVITSDRLVLGHAGFGLSLQGGPLNTYLDMGEQTATDEEGNLTGTFESYEKSEGLGLGFSTASFLRFLGPESSTINLVSRHLDVAAGVMRKSYEDALASDDFLQDRTGGSTKATMTDYGVLLQGSLYNSMDGPGYLPDLDRALYPVISGWRITGAYGRSWLNWGDDMLVYPEADQADPMPREYRKGTSLRFEIGLPGVLKDILPPLLAEALSPLVAFSKSWEERWPGYVWDEDSEEYIYEEDTSGQYNEDSGGQELTILGVYSQREGHNTALYGDINDDTEGWGLHLNLAGIHARYDHATVPQATGLPTVDRESWTLMVDVMEIMKRRRN